MVERGSACKVALGYNIRRFEFGEWGGGANIKVQVFVVLVMSSDCARGKRAALPKVSKVVAGF
jgi:hypothetical protein